MQAGDPARVEYPLWAETASSPAAYAAAHGPICAAIGDRVNQHFADVIIDHEGDDGFPSCRDRAQSRGDFIAETALVRPSGLRRISNWGSRAAMYAFDPLLDLLKV